MADFNARTGSEEDLIISDDTSHVPLSDNQYVIDTAVGKRSSHDSHIDTRGKELLDMCISNQLRILNGRTFGDTFGAYTCYKPAGCSVVDYVIVSQHLLCQILYMQISNFYAGMSDCHCKLSFKILASYQREIINRKLKDFPNRYIWNDKSSEDFTKGFLNPNIKNKLDTFLKDEINLATSDINKATNDLHSVIQQVADLTLRKKSKNKRKKNTE
jgi:hypothetical protein